MRITKLLLSLRAGEPDEAVTDPEKDPVVAKDGARWMFPVRTVPACAFEVTDMKVGPVNVNVIASASASVARIASSAVDPAQNVMLAMGSSTGSRSVFVMVRFVI